jgi:hypothetical protein
LLTYRFGSFVGSFVGVSKVKEQDRREERQRKDGGDSTCLAFLEDDDRSRPSHKYVILFVAYSGKLLYLY